MWGIHRGAWYELTLGVHHGLKTGCLGTRMERLAGGRWNSRCFCDCLGEQDESEYDEDDAKHCLYLVLNERTRNLHRARNSFTYYTVFFIKIFFR